MSNLVSPDHVGHVARLARLRLAPDDLELFTAQFNQILAYVTKLESVDVTGVEPMESVLESANVLRDDEPGPHLSTAEALSNAPRKTEGFFSVPKVLE